MTNSANRSEFFFSVSMSKPYSLVFDVENVTNMSILPYSNSMASMHDGKPTSIWANVVPMSTRQKSNFFKISMHDKDVFFHLVRHWCQDKNV